MSKPGAGSALYVVATPIGNLGDMGARAIEVLRTVDLILAEDTRTSRVLLNHFNIDTALQSYHSYTSTTRTRSLLNKLRAGMRVALISDAGTPLLSDPGYPLLDLALKHEVPVFSVPGPSALSAALAVCGLPIGRFVYEGFLSANRATRRNSLHGLRTEMRTMVFFESPHRLQACLEDMCDVFGALRPATLVREISKIHEQVMRATLSALLADIAAHPDHGRGEHVLLVAGADEPEVDLAMERKLLGALMEELSLSRAVRLAGKISKLKHARLYRLALEIQQSRTDPGRGTHGLE